MKSVKFTYSLNEVLKKMGEFCEMRGLRFKGFATDKDGDVYGISVSHRGNTADIGNDSICIAFGGVGGTYSHKGYNAPKVKWTGKGKNAKCHIWK